MQIKVEEIFTYKETEYKLKKIDNHKKYNTFYKVFQGKNIIGIIKPFSRFGDFDWYSVKQPEEIVQNSTFGIGTKQKCLEYLVDFTTNRNK
jgi:hypothetical protein